MFLERKFKTLTIYVSEKQVLFPSTQNSYKLNQNFIFSYQSSISSTRDSFVQPANHLYNKSSIYNTSHYKLKNIDSPTLNTIEGKTRKLLLEYYTQCQELFETSFGELVKAVNNGIDVLYIIVFY